MLELLRSWMVQIWKVFVTRTVHLTKESQCQGGCNSYLLPAARLNLVLHFVAFF